MNSAVTTKGLLVSGEWGLLKVQVLAVLVTYAMAVLGSLLCLAITGVVTAGLRVNEDDEFTGLDLSQHSENAYILSGAGAGASLGGMHTTQAQRVTA